MKNIILTISSAILLLAAVSIKAEPAQSSVKWKVISAGGTKSSASGKVLNATIGQTSTTFSTAGSTSLQAGFWQSGGIPGNCCMGIRGDLDSDGEDNSVLDLTFMIDRIFRGGLPATCPDEADVDEDGTPSTVLDLTFMIDDIFRGGPDPGPC